VSYFTDYYPTIRLPRAEGSTPGLRRAQLGGAHAIAAHFTLSNECAIVTMPTGSGKTAVLQLAPFLLAGRRALVLAPSRLLRGQIASDFGNLKSMRRARCALAEVPDPKVKELVKRVRSPAEWQALDAFDVVIATPQCVSSSIASIPMPPADLFDVVLVDEAHHAPATTWNAVLTAHPDAKRILFTATPYRRDRKEIPGDFVYTYPLARAKADGIFADLSYEKVDCDGPDTDAAIASAAEAALQRDRAAGLRHYLLVRAANLRRSGELVGVYRRRTKLRLAEINSQMTFRKVRMQLDRLDAGQLDGVIAVGMLGEGIDIPRFKVAALHAPHKTLGATLQFIGRLARTGGDDIGTATFLAVPQEVEGELGELYAADLAWSELVPALADTRIESERELRVALKSFRVVQRPAAAPEDLSLYSLRPFRHVKVYRATDLELMKTEIHLPGQREVLYRLESERLSSLVLVGRSVGRPKWSDSDVLLDTVHDLVVIHWCESHGLLFVGATVKSPAFYDVLIQELGVEPTARIRSYEGARVLRRLTDPKFFSLGMRRRVLSPNVESYRIAAGPETEKSLTSAATRSFQRGHATARGRRGAGHETLGVSSSSKVWSNTASQVPAFVKWCDELAAEIANDSPVVTNTEYDQLPQPMPIQQLSARVVAGVWDEDVYVTGRLLEVIDENGAIQEVPLAECAIVVLAGDAGDREIGFGIEAGIAEPLVTCRFGVDPMFEIDPALNERVFVTSDEDRVPLADYLAAEPPVFLLANVTTVCGDESAARSGPIAASYEASSVRTIDWMAAAVDIGVEAGVAPVGSRSIQDWAEQDLRAEKFEVVLHDHGQGEVADFICLRRDPDGRMGITLVHCKASSADRPGARVQDVYELAGQAVRSVPKLMDQEGLERAIGRRLNRPHPSRFVAGARQVLDSCLRSMRTDGPAFHIRIVQPGMSARAASMDVLELLGAVDTYCRENGCERLEVIGAP